LINAGVMMQLGECESEIVLDAGFMGELVGEKHL
jgi:hypothetical protein